MKRDDERGEREAGMGWRIDADLIVKVTEGRISMVEPCRAQWVFVELSGFCCAKASHQKAFRDCGSFQGGPRRLPVQNFPRMP